MPHGPTVLIWNRLLLGVDDSEKSLAAVNYVAAVLGGSSNCQIRIVSIHQPLNPDNHPDAAARNDRDARDVAARQAMLKNARATLREAGVPAENISCELIAASGQTVGEALMGYQKRHGFGTVVVGRRGLSKTEEFLFGSVSAAAVHQAQDCCIWVVG